ncbi:MAG TPA: Hsp20/alpha crystallin family protein [Dehalococcoidia bacterium]|nr:Hsp20/alpha crystallin family protein [Dehalococcoidia bacterium]
MATITGWAPVGEAISLRDAIDRLLERSVLEHRPATGRQEQHAVAQSQRLPVDVYETPHECVVRTWAPGMRAEQIAIDWNQGVLSIRGTLPPTEPGGQQIAWRARELPSGDFAVAIPLSGQFDVERAQAALDAGVLTLHIPKTAAAQPKVIRVGTPTG